MKALSYCDIFGPSPELYIRGNKRYISVFGSFISVIYFFIFFLFVISFSISVFSRKNFSLFSNEVLSADTENPLYLSEFPVVFRTLLINGESFDNSVGTFSAFYLKLNGTNYYAQEVKMIPCPKETLLKLELVPAEKNLFCLDPEFTKNNPIKDGNGHFSAYHVNFQRCTNSTLPFQCKDTKYIDSILQFSYLYYTYFDVDIDHMQVNSPGIIYPRSDFFRVELSSTTYYTLRWKEIKYITDLAYIFESFTESIYYGFDDNFKNYEKQYNNLYPSQNLASFTLTMHPKKLTYNKTYNKIPQLLSHLFGVLLFFYFILKELTQFIIKPFFYASIYTQLEGEKETNKEKAIPKMDKSEFIQINQQRNNWMYLTYYKF
jgi:hypothetical protein